MEATWMSTGRRMGKETVAHIHHGISATEKEHIWVSSNEVAETGAYYTEWSKPQTETWIQYINAYIWNLERWEWQLYMQDSKRDTDIKKRLLDYMEEGEGGTIWENSTETCILPYVKTDDQQKFDAWSRTLKASALILRAGCCLQSIQEDSELQEVVSSLSCPRKFCLPQCHEEVWKKTKTLREAVAIPVHSTR